MKILFRAAAAAVLILPLAILGETGFATEPSNYHHWAPTPPMGWNSYDAFGDSVTEEEFLSNAEFVKKNLAAHGWQYVVIDYRWYDPEAHSSDLPKDRMGAALCADAFGRLLPAPNRFPSAADGKGFKTLADKVHAMGLKFGIHVMRGIPRNSVNANTPIEGSELKAADAANLKSTCGWNPDMYGVNGATPAGQAWYDSIIRIYAQWGVDLIKVDDLSNSYSAGEIEAIRKAIDKCGRPIVFSTSPGPTPLAQAEHIKANANMWRISGDFWDKWRDLFSQFERLAAWAPYQGPGHFADADMIPFGKLAVRCHDGGNPHMSGFSHEEQKTLMTLWCIARSPLMLGGNLPEYESYTQSLIANGEVLAVNQNSANGHQLFRKAGQIAWVADAPGGRDKYLALFRVDNTEVSLDRAVFASGVVSRETPGHAVDIDADITGATKLYLMVSDAQDGFYGDHADWISPKITGPSGTLKLEDIPWKSASSGWGKARVNQSVSGAPMMVDGKSATGIGTHAQSVIEYELPQGYTRFQARGGLDDEVLKEAKGATVRFAVFTENPFQLAAPRVAVSLKELGLSGKCKFRDLWANKDAGVYEGDFSVTLPEHGAALYRVSPAK